MASQEEIRKMIAKIGTPAKLAEYLIELEKKIAGPKKEKAPKDKKSGK